jgi:AMP-polyphosphate phosphotransferase
MLEAVDLSEKLSDDEYNKLMPPIQLRLVRLQQQVRAAGVPVIIMYEGWDAAGKGGSIRRITESLDARGLLVWPIGPPTDTEREHHYLWRFWTRLPAKGQIAIFDRSWYGRVLVERVEKLAKHEAWKRAYEEIRCFERTLVDDGAVLVKFWLHISPAEQLKRFKAREKDPYKSWKITPDDWEDRKRWDDYVKAAEDMFAETDTAECPWHLIAAENKCHARVETARIVADRLEQAVAKTHKSEKHD